MKNIFQTIEEKRLEEDKKKGGIWKKWGPYLSERQWGTVREDYSSNCEPWQYFSYKDALFKAYRWGEDGIGGISDLKSRLCFSIAFWNEKDDFIKERLFGLTGPQGNHGEDVKEYYYYIDNTPTHSYMKFLYKYCQNKFPYEELIEKNKNLQRTEPEYELIDTGIFENDEYFDIFLEYAKSSSDDILIKIEIINRAERSANLHFIPQLFFRNTWSWGQDDRKPRLHLNNINTIEANHHDLGKMYLYFEGEAQQLFTDNESNNYKLYGSPNYNQFLKDGINDFIVQGQSDKVNPKNFGTKAGIHYRLNFNKHESKVLKLRLTDKKLVKPFDNDFDKVFIQRIKEADEFYGILNFENRHLETKESKKISRQALSGLLWSKQFYNYNVNDWLYGDPLQPKPPIERLNGRNKDWKHFSSEHIMSMPDKWEYPWFAAWDLAFHAVPLALIDPEFAKEQLLILTKPEFMHPSGELPAYEWNFSDVNPPVHAWATLKIYQLEKESKGIGDKIFLEKVFQKLLLNFTWWVNRKDIEGKNIFQGGFLGLDNIGVFDRSAPLPKGGHIEQADASAWMAMYCLDMLNISLELAESNEVYEEMAIKFFEHFLYIADSMNHIGGSGLWDNVDKFYYDILNIPGEESFHMKIRSMVGIIPLFAVSSIDTELLEKFPRFNERLNWFIKNRPELIDDIAPLNEMHKKGRRILSIVGKEKLCHILEKLLDEDEFLSEFGIRALSKYHKNHPYYLQMEGQNYSVQYLHGESDTTLFGGNSNWRGPIWFPLNFLLIEALQKYYKYYGDELKFEYPTNSGHKTNLLNISEDIAKRLVMIFKRNKDHYISSFGTDKDMHKFQKDLNWSNYIFFNEYFDGDDGKGLGANHQTGWTALVAELIHQLALYNKGDRKI